MAKTVLCACLDWVLEFDSEKEAQRYLGRLREEDKPFTLVYYTCVGKRRRVKVRLQYRKHPFWTEGGTQPC